MVANQANLFLIFTLNGIIIGLLFDIFRILRKSFKTPDMVTYIEDICFWIITGLILLYSIFKFSNGEIRFYMFIAIFLGCLIYMILFSKYFIKVNVKIVTFISKILENTFKTIIFPIKVLYKFLKKYIFKSIHFTTINIKKIKTIKHKSLKSNTQT